MVEKAYWFNSASLKALDDEYVEGYISTGDRDLVNDIVTPNCMVDMLAQMKDRIITLDVEHETFRGKDHVEKEINKSLNPVAKIVSAALDGKGIKVKTALNPHNPRYEEIKGSIQDEFLNAFSIAYVPVDFKTREDGTRMLDKVNLLNVTFTGVPVNPEASITNVMLKSIEEGVLMDTKVVEAKATVDSGPKLENLEVKSLSEKVEALTKELSELKAAAAKKAEADKEEDDEKKKEAKSDDEDEDNKEEEMKKKAFEAQEVKVKSLEAEVKALQDAMNKPQFKAILEPVKESKSVVEAKSAVKGPLDYI